MARDRAHPTSPKRAPLWVYALLERVTQQACERYGAEASTVFRTTRWAPPMHVRRARADVVTAMWKAYPHRHILAHAMGLHYDTLRDWLKRAGHYSRRDTAAA